MIKFTRVSIADMLDVCGGGLLYDRMVDCVALVGEKMSWKNRKIMVWKTQ